MIEQLSKDYTLRWVWYDCQRPFRRRELMLAGWRNLILHLALPPQIYATPAEVRISRECDRGAVICPAHACQLQSILVPHIETAA